MTLFSWVLVSYWIPNSSNVWDSDGRCKSTTSKIVIIVINLQVILLFYTFSKKTHQCSYKIQFVFFMLLLFKTKTWSTIMKMPCQGRMRKSTYFGDILYLISWSNNFLCYQWRVLSVNLRVWPPTKIWTLCFMLNLVFYHSK